MSNKEMVMNVITEYVISKEAGALDATYFNGMVDGMLVGLGAHENVVALIALYNEVLKSL